MKSLLSLFFLPLCLSAAPVDLLAGRSFPGSSLMKGGGTGFRFDMGLKRQNWNHARWSVLELEQPLDLRGTDALLLDVHSPSPRRDVGIHLALREAGGCWYSHPWAAALSAAENPGVARFEHFSPPAYHTPGGGSFRDANGQLDLDGITAIAVGVVNPLGVGEVTFVLRSLRAEPLPTGEAPAVTAEVTGKLLDVNGTRFLPAGVFGSYNLRTMPGENAQPRVARYRLAMDRKIEYNLFADTPVFGSGLTPIMIHAIGDRTQASPRATVPDWQARYRAAGTAYGEKVKAAGRTAHVEFWNEPYLNWANDNRIMFNPAFYDEGRATEGGPVHLRMDGTEMPHLRWTRDPSVPHYNWLRAGLQEWRRGVSADGKMSVSEFARPYRTSIPQWRKLVAERNPPDTLPDGETYTVGTTTYTAKHPWVVHDETQFTYWSGQGMLTYYLEPMAIYGEALKTAAGDAVQFIVGWGNRPSEDHWAAFHLLYKPTIDHGIRFIDAYNDHDYGSDPRTMSANYEVVTAYGMAEHGKWLYAYNTETASNADPQTLSGEVHLSGDGNKFTWVTRKIANTLSLSVDKCRGPAHFGVGGGFWSDGGEGVAMDLLRNLRGRLVQVINPEPSIHLVAAIDGSDPEHPRPDDLPQRQELVVLALNDSAQTRELRLHLRPPEGTRFVDGLVRWGRVDTASGAVRIEEVSLPNEADLCLWTATLPPGVPAVITLGLSGDIAPDAPARVIRRQHFAKAILREIDPSRPLADAIHLEESSTPVRAWFRFVAERLAENEAVLLLNGHRIPLPAVVSPENNPLTCELVIDPAWLRRENQVEIQVPDPQQAGFLLGMASLLVEYER